MVGYTYGGGTSRAVAGRPGRIVTAPGLDPAGSSLIDAAAGAYWLGSGRLADGSYGDLLWRGARPALLPSGFDGSGVNRHGAVAGFLEQSGQPAVVTGGQVQVLPTPPGTGPYESAATDIDMTAPWSASRTGTRSAGAAPPESIPGGPHRGPTAARR